MASSHFDHLSGSPPPVGFDPIERAITLPRPGDRFHRQVELLAFDVRKMLPVNPKIDAEDVRWDMRTLPSGL